MRAHVLTRLSVADLPWAEIRIFIRRAWWMWIGAVALALGAYADRFTLASFLTLSDVGVATFYTSFTTAVVYLVQSGTTQVSYPLLIEHYEARRRVEFRREFVRTATSAALLGAAFLGGLGIGMPFLAEVIGKPELQAAYPAFVVLLVGTWVRINAETLYFALFVERRDKSIWVGNLLYLACSLVSNVLLIRSMGMMGLAIATVISAGFIAAWRGYHAMSFEGNMLGNGKRFVS